MNWRANYRQDASDAYNVSFVLRSSTACLCYTVGVSNFWLDITDMDTCRFHPMRWVWLVLDQVITFFMVISQKH